MQGGKIMANFIKKHTYILNALLTILLYTIVQETMYFIFSFFNGAFYDNGQLLVLLALMAAALLCIPLYYRWYRYHIRFKKHIMIKEALSYKNVIVVCILGITINLLIASLVEIFNVTLYFPNYNDSISIFLDGNMILSSILVIFLAPITEELIHRGIVYEYFKKSGNKMIANIVQASLFAIVHGNMLQILYSFVLGLLLGYIYEKYKSIYAPILTHGFFNATSIINSFIFSDEMANNNLIMTIVCIVSGIIFIIAYDIMKKSKTIEYIPEPGVKMITLKDLE